MQTTTSSRLTLAHAGDVKQALPLLHVPSHALLIGPPGQRPAKRKQRARTSDQPELADESSGVATYDERKNSKGKRGRKRAGDSASASVLPSSSPANLNTASLLLDYFNPRTNTPIVVPHKDLRELTELQAFTRVRAESALAFRAQYKVVVGKTKDSAGISYGDVEVLNPFPACVTLSHKPAFDLNQAELAFVPEWAQNQNVNWGVASIYKHDDRFLSQQALRDAILLSYTNDPSTGLLQAQEVENMLADPIVSKRAVGRLSVAFLPEKEDYGVFAKEPLKRDSLVAIYVGEYITVDEAIHRNKQKTQMSTVGVDMNLCECPATKPEKRKKVTITPREPTEQRRLANTRVVSLRAPRDTPLAELTDVVVIDPTTVGNITRFIRQAGLGTRASCDIRVSLIEHDGGMYPVASVYVASWRSLVPGDELTLDYTAVRSGARSNGSDSAEHDSSEEELRDDGNGTDASLLWNKLAAPKTVVDGEQDNTSSDGIGESGARQRSPRLESADGQQGGLVQQGGVQLMPLLTWPQLPVFDELTLTLAERRALDDAEHGAFNDAYQRLLGKQNKEWKRMYLRYRGAQKQSNRKRRDRRKKAKKSGGTPRAERPRFEKAHEQFETASERMKMLLAGSSVEQRAQGALEQTNGQSELVFEEGLPASKLGARQEQSISGEPTGRDLSTKPAAIGWPVYKALAGPSNVGEEGWERNYADIYDFVDFLLQFRQGDVMEMVCWIVFALCHQQFLWIFVDNLIVLGGANYEYRFEHAVDFAASQIALYINSAIVPTYGRLFAGVCFDNATVGALSLFIQEHGLGLQLAEDFQALYRDVHEGVRDRLGHVLPPVAHVSSKIDTSAQHAPKPAAIGWPIVVMTPPGGPATEEATARTYSTAADFVDYLTKFVRAPLVFSLFMRLRALIEADCIVMIGDTLSVVEEDFDNRAKRAEERTIQDARDYWVGYFVPRYGVECMRDVLFRANVYELQRFIARRRLHVQLSSRFVDLFNSIHAIALWAVSLALDPQERLGHADGHTTMEE